MLTLLPTPLGNLQDISYRAIEVFESATLVLCEDTRITRRLLRLLCDRNMMRMPLAEFVSFHQHNGKERLEMIGERLHKETVVYVSDAGMPGISDPGQLLVEYCQERNIPYDVLPGPSAVITAYAASGFSSGRFLFYGFLPRRGRERREALEAVLRERYDIVLYEAPHRLHKLLNAIEEIDGDREIFAVKEISKQCQKYYRGCANGLLKELAADGEIRGEWVIVIKGKETCRKALYLEDILASDIPPRFRAKLLARLTGESGKTWYGRLIGKS